MAKAIFITGICGSGKSAISDELVKRGFNSFDIENIPGLFRMVNKKTREVVDQDNDNLEDCKNNDWVCDTNKLKKIIAKNRHSIAFYCGIPSNWEEVMPLFDKVFLLKVGDKTMCRRLTTRTSNDYGRTKEVQDWILTWKSWVENHFKEKGAIVINANRKLKTVVDDILERIK